VASGAVGTNPDGTAPLVPPGAPAGQSASVVNAPQLVSASGSTYTFDRSVLAGSKNPAAAFHLYDADGTELTCTQQSLTGATVTCAQFMVGTTTTATAAQVSAATLATVDAGAVTGSTSNTNPNPEGAVRV
jgi:hypothetical protein